MRLSFRGFLGITHSLFLDEETRKIADDVAKDSPLARGMVKLRTKYFDDTLSEQIEKGCRQVVILGSGLDTRPVRKSQKNVTYFEIDSLDILQFKEKIY